MQANVIEYQCPHCNAQHRAPVEFAGNRQPCSECGKQIRLPAYVADNDQRTATTGVHQNMAGSVVITCSLCQNQLYATTEQIGQEIMCENCLESVLVTAPDKTQPAASEQSQTVANMNPLATTPAETPRSPVTSSPTTPAGQTAPTRNEPAQAQPAPEQVRPAAESTTEEEIVDLEPIDNLESYEVMSISPPETDQQSTDSPGSAEQYELVIQWNIACQSCQTHLIVNPEDIGNTLQCPDCAQPVTVQAPQQMPTPSRRLINSSDPPGIPTDSPATRVATKAANQPAPAKPEPEFDMLIQWEVGCPVCHSAVVATPADIGSTMKCPDCFKALPIMRPETMPQPVKRRKSSQVPEEAEQEAFDITTAPVMRENISRDPHSVSEMFLQQAQKEHEEIVAEEEEVFENSWLKMLVMVGSNVTLLSRVAMLLLAWIANAGIFQLTRSDTVTNSPAKGYMVAIIVIVGIVFFMLLSLLAFTTLINIVRQTALGDLKITQWPPFDIVDWIMESLSVYIALGTAATPGVLLFIFFRAITPAEALIFVQAAIAVLITAALLPFTLLSIFENDRLYLPYSRELQQRISTYPELMVKFILTSLPMVALCMLTFPLLLSSESFVAIAFSIAALWISLVMYTRNIGIYALLLTGETES